MDETSQLSEFGKIFIYLIMGVLFVLFTFFMGKLVALKKPNPEKLASYECGEEPVGNSWIQFNSRFYVIALVFLLFDVELAFIFPWATVFSQQELINIDPYWGWLSLIEMFIFVGILLIGLVYVWKKGDLNWIRPEQYSPISPSKIPPSSYKALNAETYQTKLFSIDSEIPMPEKVLTESPLSSI
ncbi:MAG: NADH-quinone oxidoreductase subunit A, partial [Daejeonella sp.]|nr:NADH-quinone oxidoreductase subunit A [Daejeonella sp.]